MSCKILYFSSKDNEIKLSKQIKRRKLTFSKQINCGKLKLSKQINCGKLKLSKQICELLDTRTDARAGCSSWYHRPCKHQVSQRERKEPLFLFIDMSGVSRGATHSSLPSGGKVWITKCSIPIGRHCLGH